MRLEGFVDSSEILRAGVYALVAKGVVIYIGKAKRLVSRIDTHHRVWTEKRRGKESWLADRLGVPGLLFDEVHIRPCRLEELDEVEAAMIARYKPRYNVQLKRRSPVNVPIVINGVPLIANECRGLGITRRV